MTVIVRTVRAGETASPEATIFGDRELSWRRPTPRRKKQTLAKANAQMSLSRKEVLRRAEANTLRLTGKTRF